jgi:hypothetical protein
VPQIYWEIGGTQDRFRVLDQWWRDQNVKNRLVWPGLYTSHVYAGTDRWPMREIPAQVAQIRAARAGSDDTPGEVHFRLAALFAEDNRLGLMLSDLYRERAIVPAAPWLGARVPAAPQLSLVPGNGAASFTLAPGDSTHVRWWLIQTRNSSGAWTTSLRPTGEGQLIASVLGGADIDEIAVSAISATGVASVPTIVTP